MLVEQLRKAWRVREAAPVDAVLRFEAAGLILGAGTLMARAGGERDTQDADDDRLLALLSVAYGHERAIQSQGHIKAAAARWSHGDQTRAQLHVALARLGPLRRPREDARRLFMADGLMRGGVSPMAILQATGAEVAKYRPDQPRVPAGNSILSGRWAPAAGPVGGSAPLPGSGLTAPRARPVNVRGGGASRAAGVAAVGGRLGVGLDLGALSGAALRTLARFVIAAVTPEAIAAGGAVAVAGVLFIPSGGPKGKWVSLGGPVGLSYFQNPDETAVLFRYTARTGEQVDVPTTLGPGGRLRDSKGQVIARWVKAGVGTGLVLNTTVLPGLDQKGPKLCPDWSRDRGGPLGEAYANYMKAKFNPGSPTPPGMAYAFAGPNKLGVVMIDDCQWATGNLAEYKGPGYAEHLLKRDAVWDGMYAEMIKGAKVQRVARGDRHLIWYFSDKSVADYMRKEFDNLKFGIEVEWDHLPEERR